MTTNLIITTVTNTHMSIASPMSQSAQPTAQLPAWTASLLRLVSPGLPIGGYAYSKGLEHAVHAGWVRDEASAREWILGLLEHAIGQLDAPVLLRVHDALQAHDASGAVRWNAILRAHRESEELALEDAQIGAALRRLLGTLQVVSEDDELTRVELSYVAAFAWAAVRWQIPRLAALEGYLWATLESQTSAAVRLLPLGQSAGQRVLSAGLLRLPPVIERASQLTDADIGAVAPRFAMGSALHETQYSRLFRS